MLVTPGVRRVTVGFAVALAAVSCAGPSQAADSQSLTNDVFVPLTADPTSPCPAGGIDVFADFNGEGVPD